MTSSRPNLTDDIEKLIDATSLLDVLTAIECVCGEKADHIRVNSQDSIAARLWDKASRAVGQAARTDGVTAVS